MEVLTTGSPREIAEIDLALERMGWDVNLFCILCKEGCDCTLEEERGIMRIYTTAWEYEEPITVKSNEDLLCTVKDLILSSYSGIEEYIPEEYAEIINGGTKRNEIK